MGVSYSVLNGNALDWREIISDVHNPILVSDPPFNIGYHYAHYEDAMNNDEYWEMLVRVFSGVPSIIVHYPECLHTLSRLLGNSPNRVVSWVYNSNTAKQHRDIAYYGVEVDFNLVKQPYKNPNDKRIMERIANGSTGARLYDWWNVNQVKNVSKTKLNHPCIMPTEVMRNALGVIKDKNVTVVDPFCGSGTTLLAALDLGIPAIGIDISEEYCKLALSRIKECEY